MSKEKQEQIGLNCIGLIKKKTGKKITREEYYAGLMELHHKYPMKSHEPPLAAFQLQNHRSIKMSSKDRDTGVIYHDHLFPFNFQEAAEMFIRHEEKMAKKTLPMPVWKKKEWPVSISSWRDNDENSEPELIGPIAIEFEKKRKVIQIKTQKEWLPYREDEVNND